MKHAICHWWHMWHGLATSVLDVAVNIVGQDNIMQAMNKFNKGKSSWSFRCTSVVMATGTIIQYTSFCILARIVPHTHLHTHYTLSKTTSYVYRICVQALARCSSSSMHSCLVMDICSLAGWAMQCAGFLFLQRDWKHDYSWITQSVKYLSRVGCRPQVSTF